MKLFFSSHMCLLTSVLFCRDRGNLYHYRKFTCVAGQCDQKLFCNIVVAYLQRKNITKLFIQSDLWLICCFYFTWFVSNIYFFTAVLFLRNKDYFLNHWYLCPSRFRLGNQNYKLKGGVNCLAWVCLSAIIS